jgi:hypothetical protein
MLVKSALGVAAIAAAMVASGTQAQQPAPPGSGVTIPGSSVTITDPSLAASVISGGCISNTLGHVANDVDLSRGVAECLAKAAAKQRDPRTRKQLLDDEAKWRADEVRLRKPGAVIGMTADQVRNETHWGPPARINRTVTAEGVREQWVYREAYFYFGLSRAGSWRSGRRV